MVPLSGYLTISAFLFTLGVLGVIIKRNPIVVFMCIELMLNAVNLSLVAFARHHPSPAANANLAETVLTGHMFVIFVMAVAAAEVAVGLGIIMSIYRVRKKIDVDDMSVLRG
ncbi:MAG: NADH-quinone oxidoreductase subunit K [Fimbriimonadales bacterium]